MRNGSANRNNSHASAVTAAETISDKGRARRRSVKNRRTFSISREQSRTCSGYAEARKRLRSEILIASKVPKASDLAQSQGRTRNRFTAAAFNGIAFVFLLRASAIHASMIALGLASVGSTFWVTKGGNTATLRVAQFAAAPTRRTAKAFMPPSANGPAL